MWTVFWTFLTPSPFLECFNKLGLCSKVHVFYRLMKKLQITKFLQKHLTRLVKIL